jgi:hypothetical protein
VIFLSVNSPLEELRSQVRLVLKNLAVFFDRFLTMDFQIKHLVKTCYFQLKNISRIRNLIPEDACQTLIRLLVLSRLNYGNGLLYTVKQVTKCSKYCCPTNVTRSSRCDHISPILISLHWLPVIFRLKFY